MLFWTARRRGKWKTAGNRMRSGADSGGKAFKLGGDRNRSWNGEASINLVIFRSQHLLQNEETHNYKIYWLIWGQLRFWLSLLQKFTKPAAVPWIKVPFPYFIQSILYLVWHRTGWLKGRQISSFIQHYFLNSGITIPENVRTFWKFSTLCSTSFQKLLCHFLIKVMALADT